MKTQQIFSIIVPKKIKHTETLIQILDSKHSPVRFLGMNFTPKYKLDQDTFEHIVPPEKLVIPENLYLKFTGIGNPTVQLELAQGAVFKAKNATFADTTNSGRKLVLDTVIGSLESFKAAKSKVNTVTKDALTHEFSSQKNGEVWGNAQSYNHSKQSNKKVGKNADSYGHSEQENGVVKDTAASHHKSYQTNEKVRNADSYDKSTQENICVRNAASSKDKSTQSNNTVKNMATSAQKSTQSNLVVLKNAASFHKSKQTNYRTDIMSVSFDESTQIIGTARNMAKYGRSKQVLLPVLERNIADFYM